MSVVLVSDDAVQRRRLRDLQWSSIVCAAGAHGWRPPCPPDESGACRSHSNCTGWFLLATPWPNPHVDAKAADALADALERALGDECWCTEPDSPNPVVGASRNVRLPNIPGLLDFFRSGGFRVERSEAEAELADGDHRTPPSSHVRTQAGPHVAASAPQGGSLDQQVADAKYPIGPVSWDIEEELPPPPDQGAPFLYAARRGELEPGVLVTVTVSDGTTADALVASVGADYQWCEDSVTERASICRLADGRWFYVLNTGDTYEDGRVFNSLRDLVRYVWAARREEPVGLAVLEQLNLLRLELPADARTAVEGDRRV